MPDATDAKARIPKIHFAAMLGVAVDDDLLPWWTLHYRSLELDTYRVFLHLSGDAERDDQAERYLIDSGFRVLTLPPDALKYFPIQPGAPDGIRRTLLETFAMALPIGDFLITADGDEFQEWRETPREAVARGIELVFGSLVDCFDETLHAPDPNLGLDKNYPIRHENISSLWRDIPFNHKKICMAPAHLPVNYSGSHDLILPKQSGFRVTVSSGPIEVLHYRWREGALQRVKDRDYWEDTDKAAVRKFFSVEV